MMRNTRIRRKLTGTVAAILSLFLCALCGCGADIGDPADTADSTDSVETTDSAEMTETTDTGAADGAPSARELTVTLELAVPGGDPVRFEQTVPVTGEEGSYTVCADRFEPEYIALPDYTADGIYDRALTVGGESRGGEFRYADSDQLIFARSLICIPVAYGSVYDVLLYDINTGALSDLDGNMYASADAYVAERLIPEATAVPWALPEGEDAAEYYLRHITTSSALYRDYYRLLAYAPIPSADGMWIFYLRSDGAGTHSCDYMAYNIESGKSMLLSEDSFGTYSLASFAEERLYSTAQGEVFIFPWMQSRYDGAYTVTVARFDGEQWRTFNGDLS